MLFFKITRRGARDPKSLVMPAGYPEGTAMQEDTANPGNAILADGSAPAMFLNRTVSASSPAAPLPSLAELSGGLPQLEQPYTSGYEGSLEDADEVVAEGSDYVQGSGSDKIDANTALKTQCSFRDGKFC